MKRFALLLVTLALLVAASSAMANSTSGTYSSLNGLGSNASPTVTVSSAAAGTGSGPANGATAQSTLPFTGLDVLLLAAGGGTLLGAGLVVRRLSRGVS